MSIVARKALFLCLVVVFFVQTWLVYSDPAGRTAPALSAAAAHGRAIWLAHNCQSCHQLYGFGGFLGPDLTNATERLSRARLDTVLTVGAGQMPAFELPAADRRAIETFLAEVNATGVGQLPPLRGVSIAATLDQVVAAAIKAGGAPPSPVELRGRDIVVEQKCLGCHLPNPLADKKGTDMTQLVPKLGAGGIKAIVGAGIATKGMPRFELTASEGDALVAFLAWLATNAEAVHTTFEAATLRGEAGSTLPWFEYAR